MKQLWDKLAKKNSRYYIQSGFGKGITEEQFRQSGKEDYEKYVASDPLMKSYGVFLEIGCGTGRMTEFINKKYDVVATDISEEMINQAKNRLDGIYFLVTDGETLPIPSESIDIVFSYLVFQHMKTMEMVESNFREAYRVLKPGGLFKVRVRIDKIDSMDPWWAGVTCDESYPLSIGFKLLKEEKVGNYGKWLWLAK